MSEKSNQDLEKEIEELYCSLLLQIGYSLEQAIKEIRKVIQDCKEEAKKDGWNTVSKDFGDWVINNYRLGNPLAKKIVEKARKDSATEEDIKKYWNLNEWERRLMIWYDNIFRIAAYEKAKDEDLSPEKALIRVNKGSPRYGDPDDTSKLSGDDRPLPFELKDRVNAYIMKHGYSLDHEILDKYTTMNAYIRSEIKKGKI